MLARDICTSSLGQGWGGPPAVLARDILALLARNGELGCPLAVLARDREGRPSSIVGSGYSNFCWPRIGFCKPGMEFYCQEMWFFWPG